MKKIYGILGGAFLLVALSVSCKKQDTIPTPTPDPKGTTSTLNLDLTGTFDELKAMQFDVTDVADQIKLSPAGDWKTHCFIRKEGQSFVGVAIVDFNAVREGTKIKLTPKSKSVAVSGIPSGQEPKKGETWYIMGIAGGGELQGTDKVSFAYNYSLDAPLDVEANINKIRVPLASVWTKVNVLNNNYLESKLSFKPQGVLLRLRLMNRINKDVEADYFSLTSTAASREGYFDLSGASVREGEAPKWVFTQRPTESDPYYVELPVNQTLRASGPISSATPKFSAYKLIWVMLDPQAPATAKTKISSLKFKLNRHGEQPSVPPGGEVPPFSIHLKAGKMKNGYTHRINVELLRYKTSAEYIAPRNVGPIPRVFAIDNSITTSGYYALPLSDIKKVVPTGYHLPNEFEWQALFSPTFQHIKLDDNPGGAIPNPQKVEEKVEINHEKNTFDSYYLSKKVGRKITTYAIRFMPPQRTGQFDSNFPPYEGYEKVAAFKYELIDYDQLPEADKRNSLNVGKQLKVTSRFIGDYKHIDEIANPNYWNTPSTEQTTVVFPLCGYFDASSASGRDPNQGFSQGRTKDQMNGIGIRGWEVLPQGYYWSIRGDGKSYIQRMDTQETAVYVIGETTRDRYVIRPFVNSLD